MTRLRRRTARLARWSIVLVTLLTGIGVVRGAAQPPAVARAQGDARATTSLQCQGVSSCSAAACHNAGRAQAGSHGEYGIWFTQDKHARAYTVLTEERSRIIMRNYRGTSGGKAPKAEEDLTCLKCHALAPELAGTEHAYLNLDGVSCENCHGRAEKWLSVHYLPEWKEKADREKLRYGMTPTKSLVFRAQLCAECHIGTPDNDLNHDLYAAGHPPLYFEFSAFLGSTPKHWSEQEEKTRYPDFEVRAWALGQVVSAKAALELLESRASVNAKPWPEFAEYSCYACHHDLHADDRRQDALSKYGRKPGALPWESWFTTMLPSAVERRVAPEQSRGISEGIEALRSAMEKPIPDRLTVTGKARSLAGQLGALLPELERAQFDQPFVDELSRALAAVGGGAATWEQATQAYLAMTAVYRAGTDLGRNRSLPFSLTDLEAHRKRLQSPQRFRR